MAVFFLFCLFFAAGKVSGEPFEVFSGETFPLRVRAGADVLDLGFGRYSVNEYLDLHNDHTSTEVEILKIRADTWVGHKKDRLGENWLDHPEKLIVKPSTVERIAERQRVVDGYPHRNWLVRWLRFEVETSQGKFTSGFISSPLKRPGKPVSVLPMPKLDSHAGPGKPLSLKRQE